MTTIVVVKKNNQVAIAADSLTTFGSTRLAPSYDRSPEKIIRYADAARGDSYMGIAGSAAHQLVLESLLAKNVELNFHGKAAVYESFRKLHPLLKEEHFLNPREEEDDPYESSQLTAMIANASGIYAVYSMREVFEFETFWAIGSGRDFALGAMYTVYKRAKDAASIAKTGVEAGAEFDTGSALPLNIYSVELTSK
jgi:ATP-dependent HslUV protease, peptidase subunit HslV